MGEKVENLREQNFRLQARVAALDYVVKAQRDVMDRMALLIPDFQNMRKLTAYVRNKHFEMNVNFES